MTQPKGFKAVGKKTGLQTEKINLWFRAISKVAV